MLSRHHPLILLPFAAAGRRSRTRVQSPSFKSISLVLFVLALAMFTACGTGPEYQVSRGVIDESSTEHVVELSSDASVRRPAWLLVWTVGGPCHSAGETEVTIEGLHALVEPFDSLDLNCSSPDRIQVIFRHTARLPFAEPGIATIQVLVATRSDSLVRLDTTFVVR